VTDAPAERRSTPPAPPDSSAPAAPRIALVLPGGGARAAYQVGVLKGIAELLPRGAPTPFRVITGTSAGAIVSATVAAHAAHFREGATALERFWRQFHVDQVFRTDTRTMLRSGLRWLGALVTGGSLVPPPSSLFDVAPLRETLAKHVHFDRVRRALHDGHLDALAINASAYGSTLSVAFYECARSSAPWLHSWRQGRPTALGPEHLMASAAVPFLFPAVAIDGEFYGDGAMRQVAPLSPAINLGADRLLIVGVRAPGARTLPPPPPTGPSFGHLFGFMLDTLFMDGMQADLERLHRDNLLIDAAGGSAGGLRRIDALTLAPSDDFGAIAQRHAGAMPRALRVLLRTMGAEDAGGSMLLSYLLFEGSYTRELIGLGYRDAVARRHELASFLELDLASAGLERRRRARTRAAFDDRTVSASLPQTIGG
jgi:NTE family protein